MSGSADPVITNVPAGGTAPAAPGIPAASGIAPGNSILDALAARNPATAEPAKAADPNDNLLTGNTDPNDPENLLTGTKPEDGKEPAKEADKGAVPEAYEFKVAEGMELDAKAVEEFTPIAKELGLTQDQAQKLVDFYAAKTGDLGKSVVEGQLAAWNSQLNTWRTEAKADKEYGQGANGKTFAENVGLARKALDTFGSPELTKALDAFGVSNHPEVVRTFYRIGKAMSDDTFRSGNAGGGGTPQTMNDLARQMYPTMKQ